MPNNELLDYTQPDENIQELHRQKNIEVGAKVLSAAGFDGTYKQITDSSLSKVKNRGEKLTGSGSERRAAAYLTRLYDIVERHGTVAEQRFLNDTLANLVINPDNIPDSYWHAQEQILRDNGQARELSDHDKKFLASKIINQQRESLRPWGEYLGHKDCPYPTWFKVYAINGISKMGAFDKDKRVFRKRDETTVAPYPRLDAATLGKTYDAIADFYNLGQKDFADQPHNSKESETRDIQLEALVRSGNFNKLYSKLLLEKKVIIKTPEQSEDVHGVWQEYLPGNEERLAKAAEGTPWCIASPAVAKSYLENEYYGNNQNNRAKFILFHLQDPETGALAENACASIRLDDNGQVAEVSGLNDGQALEDSLVPTVQEKVLSLPGGEEYQQAFEDKQHLIAMDRKMQAGEYDFSEDDIRFIFESDREISTLDTYNDTDPRVIELRAYILSDKNFEERYPKGLNINGDLDLMGATITSLPNGLSVDEHLWLDNSDITSLPDNLNVGGSLSIDDTSIASLPRGLNIKGSLYANNTKITSLPEDLTVGGDIYLEDSDIASLPEGLNVHGHLYLCRTHIASLPNGLSVDGSLDIRGGSLTSVPTDLKVNGGLILPMSTKPPVPDSAYVGGNVDYSY